MADDPPEEIELAYSGLEALAQLADSATDITPADSDARPLFVAWGLLATVHRQGAAVVLLHRHGLGHETAPNRRSMLEHAAQIWWLAEDGSDAVDSMNHALKHTQQKLREAADGAGIAYDASVADAVQAAVLPPSAAQTYNNIGHLLKRIGPPLHAIYVGESMLAHASLTSAERFYSGPETDTVELLSDPRYPEDAPGPDVRAPYIALVLVWFAMSSFNRLLAGQPWTNALQRIAADAGIEDHATPTAQGGHPMT
ncbi:hypothetical protein RI578_06525 [Streptomyces sp. BB1-1-1]|uniref:DUF5677 domain-containing protein n=1 Tax=Streptomyces sp. BB1-1-1 TaxID=3074430 RepID=UPI002877952C|nr:DUF5677 domain-containing protein [Streptomyces sp. BB1-1-1]WND33968.1 hypothetical protein RI578_06525 [Streptomyces sp. BB1-1-1]